MLLSSSLQPWKGIFKVFMLACSGLKLANLGGFVVSILLKRELQAEGLKCYWSSSLLGAWGEPQYTAKEPS